MGKSKHNKKKKKLKLPDKIFAIESKDKSFMEKWYPKRNLLNFPHSFRAVISARPNTGKSTIAKHIILRQDPIFKKIYVVHIDMDSEDYSDIDGVEMINFIPSVSNHIFNGKRKTLIILDDLEYKFMSKSQLKNLDRLYGYVSSHKNVSCIVISQDAFNIPCCVRRMSNIWILGKINNDMASFLLLAKRVGLNKDIFSKIFKKYIIGEHDTFWIDRTKDTFAKYRINGYQVIDIKNFEKE